MKKSKVLIPAMALLLFSTAASITGTVAWFTSSRTFTMSAGQFEVAKLDGSLNVTLAAGIGTVKQSDSSIVLDAATRLVDSSVDLGGIAYRKVRDAANSYTSYGTPVSTWKLTTRNEKNYYVAVSWTMTFTYDFATESGPVGIYLNLKDSLFTQAEATDGAGANTGGQSSKGFRILFANSTTAALSTVWGNHVAELNAGVAEFDSETAYEVNAKVVYQGDVYQCTVATTADTPFNPAQWSKTYESSLAKTPALANLKYVSSTSATADYTATNYVTTNGGYSPYSDGAGHESAAERIATLTKTSHESETITCVAWFEGTDPNVVNSTFMQYVNASMTFYARSDVALS